MVPVVISQYGSVVRQVAVVQSVPVVGKVTLVAAVAVKVIGNPVPLVVKASAKETLLLAVKLKDSRPAKVIELVPSVVESDKVSALPLARVIDPLARVVESDRVSALPLPKVMAEVAKVEVSETVKVLPAPKVSVPDPVEITLPLIVAVESSEVEMLLAARPKAVTCPVKPDTWNLADEVDEPPITRSLVMFNGANTPLACCQKLIVPPALLQVGTPPVTVKI